MAARDGFFVRLDGVTELKRKLVGLSRRATDLRPAFHVVAENLRGHARRQFDTSGGEGGKPWPALSAATQLARATGRGYYRRIRSAANRPLVATGKLRRSFTQRGGKHVERIDARSMEWGSRHPLAHLHVQGPSARAPAPPLPKREILSFRDARQREQLITEPLRRHVLAGLREG